MLTNQKLLSRERKQCVHSEDRSNLRNREVKKESFKWTRLNNISKLKYMLAMISVLRDNGLEPIILRLFEVIKHFLKRSEFFVYACRLVFQYFRVYVGFLELLSLFLNTLQLGHRRG